jgi:hypothetical protein
LIQISAADANRRLEEALGSGRGQQVFTTPEETEKIAARPMPLRALSAAFAPREVSSAAAAKAEELRGESNLEYVFRFISPVQSIGGSIFRGVAEYMDGKVVDAPEKPEDRKWSDAWAYALGGSKKDRKSVV